MHSIIAAAVITQRLGIERIFSNVGSKRITDPQYRILWYPTYLSCGGCAYGAMKVSKRICKTETGFGDSVIGVTMNISARRYSSFVHNIRDGYTVFRHLLSDKSLLNNGRNSCMPCTRSWMLNTTKYTASIALVISLYVLGVPRHQQIPL